MRLFWKLTLVLFALAPCHTEDDYYKLLGIQRNASKADIKSAFRKLSKKFHPDVYSGDDANEKYAAISEAHEVLTDDTKRRKYDQFGKEGLKEQPGFGGMDPFGNFFHQNGQFQQEEQKGDPINLKIKVPLEDIYSGKELSFSIVKKTICSHCRGSGADNPDDVAKCDLCDGRGIYVQRVQVAPGFIQQVQSMCPKCKGKGKTIKSNCHVCGGKKVMDDLDTFKVTIEKGTPNRHKFTLHNVGGDYVDKLSSDVIVEVVDLEHPFYKRANGADLRAEVKLTLKEALLGFNKKVRHLDGHFFTLKESGVTQPNQERIIRGEGLPAHDYSSQHGDLVIVFKVSIPETFTERQKTLWRKFFST
jgi:DnaJ-related protein SCJ1